MKDDILRKIQRCMALAESDNPDEAANAVRQAKALMNKYNLDHADVLMADVEEQSIKGTTKARPAEWVLRLHNMVARAFECEAFYTYFNGYHRCDLRFVGVAPAPTIAAYTFDVLLRQLRHARQTFIREKLVATTRSNKNKKSKIADAFCVGWVRQVATKCAALNPDPKTKAKIDAYFSKEIREIKEAPTKGAASTKNGNQELAAMQMGYQAAADISLYVPVDGQDVKRLSGAL